MQSTSPWVNKRYFVRVTGVLFGIPTIVGLIWLTRDSGGGIGLWAFIVFVGAIGARVWALAMWQVFKGICGIEEHKGQSADEA